MMEVGKGRGILNCGTVPYSSSRNARPLANKRLYYYVLLLTRKIMNSLGLGVAWIQFKLYFERWMKVADTSSIGKTQKLSFMREVLSM